MHDLACFVIHLHFFLRVAVIRKYVYVRDDIVSQLISELFHSRFFAFQQLFILFYQFGHCCCACTAGSLVGRYVYTLDVRQAFDCLQCNDHLDGGTVRIGNDTARTIQCIFRVHFGNYQRYIVVHAECAGIVDHHSTIFRNGFCEFDRSTATGRNKSNIDSLEVVVMLKLLDGNLFTTESINTSGTAR